MEENKAYKPDYIENQTNNNCQQFFGPVSGCVFAMPGSDVHMPEQQTTQTSTGSKQNKSEAEQAERIQKVFKAQICTSKADWGVVYRLLVKDGKFSKSNYSAGAEFINQTCGKSVTTGHELSRSQAMTDLSGDTPDLWKSNNTSRESHNKLLHYKEIAKIYLS